MTIDGVRLKEVYDHDDDTGGDGVGDGAGGVDGDHVCHDRTRPSGQSRLQMYKNSTSPSMTSKLQAVFVGFSDSAVQQPEPLPIFVKSSKPETPKCPTVPDLEYAGCDLPMKPSSSLQMLISHDFLAEPA